MRFFRIRCDIFLSIDQSIRWEGISSFFKNRTFPQKNEVNGSLIYPLLMSTYIFKQVMRVCIKTFIINKKSLKPLKT